MKKATILVHILCALGLSLGSIAGDGVDVEVLVKSGESWDGSKLPSYPEGEPEISVLRITIPPHTALPVHKHPVINAGMLIKGALTVKTQAGETIEISAGEGLIEVVDQWHHGINSGDEPAEIIVVYAGEKGRPITVLQDASQAQQ